MKVAVALLIAAICVFGVSGIPLPTQGGVVEPYAIGHIDQLGIGYGLGGLGLGYGGLGYGGLGYGGLGYGLGGLGYGGFGLGGYGYPYYGAPVQYKYKSMSGEEADYIANTYHFPHYHDHHDHNDHHGRHHY